MQGHALNQNCETLIGRCACVPTATYSAYRPQMGGLIWTSDLILSSNNEPDAQRSRVDLIRLQRRLPRAITTWSSSMTIDTIRPHHPTIAGILFCCCNGFDDERSLLRPSWFHKVKRSNPEADTMDGDPHNQWRKGWRSVRHARERLESIIEDVGSCCCSGPKLKYFARRTRNDGKMICSSQPSRFQYDLHSYELDYLFLWDLVIKVVEEN